MKSARTTLPEEPAGDVTCGIDWARDDHAVSVVNAAVHDGDGEPDSGPPWPLTRAEVDAFAADGLTPAAMEITTIPGEPAERRWRAEFHRPR